jgi:AraC-like DNA-binding protein
LVYGGEAPGHETQLICGHFAFDAGARHVLLDSLPPFVRIEEYGKSAPDRPWTVADLACVAGLSRTAFSNRFHELLDHTPLGYLTDWRMQLARRLLIDSDLPIIDVAERSG